MKQEGSARRRGADKAKPPPGGGEQEPPPPPAPQDVEMKEEATAGGGSTGEADGKAAAAEHSQRELDTVTLEGTRATITGDSAPVIQPLLGIPGFLGSPPSDPQYPDTPDPSARHRTFSPAQASSLVQRLLSASELASGTRSP